MRTGARLLAVIGVLAGCGAAQPATPQNTEDPARVARLAFEEEAHFLNEAAKQREIELQNEPADEDARIPETTISVHRYMSKRGGGMTFETYKKGDGDEFDSSPILGISDEGDCKSVLRMRDFESPVVIDWTRIEHVRAIEKGVYIDGSVDVNVGPVGARKTLEAVRLNFRTTGTAQSVAYALEFLHLFCQH